MNILHDIISDNSDITSGFKKHYLTLYSIVLGMDAKKVLELGSGVSSPVILEALQKTGGTLTTCDPRDMEGIGLDDNFRESHKNWEYIQDYSQNVIDKLEGPFDIVLHDGSHEGKVLFKDLRKIIPKVKKGGIILVHDTNHPKLKNILLATRLAFLGHRHKKLTLPYGFGLTIIIKG